MTKVRHFNLYALTRDQADELARHLSEVLFGTALDNAVASIDLAAAFRSRPGEMKKDRAQRAAHFLKVAKLTDDLRELLQEDADPFAPRRRPAWNTAGLNWTALDTALKTVSVAAHAEADAAKPTPGERRPPDGWRDRLVSVISSIYPSGSVSIKTKDSHAERTVRMVLGFVGRETKAVHGLILDAMARQPEPPFTMKLRKGFRRPAK